MASHATEYSLAELLDHPIIGLTMRAEGLERRCLELMLDQSRSDRRRAPEFAETRAAD